MSEPPAAAAAPEGQMNQGPFTLEILPDPTASPNSADPCFLITLDFAGPGPSSLGTGSPAPYWGPAVGQPYGYYYYPSYSGYGAVPAPQPADPATPLAPLAPSLPPLTAQLQAANGGSKALNARQSGPLPLSPPPLKPTRAPPKPKTQSRLGTPHPKRAVAASASARMRPAAPAVAPPPTACAPTRPPLAERLARLSRPTRVSSEEKPPEGGRPLWSGNFAGANSPARGPAPCRLPKPQSGGKSSSTMSASMSAEKAAESGAMAMAAGNPSAPPPAPAASSQSPVIQFVSYNYRPVVLQSPGTAAVGLEAAPAARLPRHRTTSTLEALPAFSSHSDV